MCTHQPGRGNSLTEVPSSLATLICAKSKKATQHKWLPVNSTDKHIIIKG